MLIALSGVSKLTKRQKRRLERAQSRMMNNYHPENWQIMSPISSCPAFQMRWTFYEGLYWVSYKKDNNTYLDAPISLQNINNLSALTDIIATEVAKKCPGPHQSEGVIPSCNPLEALAPEYITLAEDSARVIDEMGDDCENVTQWIELQDRISSLTDEQLVNVREKGHFFKMFVDDETDRLIDLYTVCGGKKFSDKFIYNLIVLEAKNACLMPKPPGSLSWEQVKKVAKEVSANYQNEGIMSIDDKKDEITKKAYSTFVLEATAEGAKSILPEGVDPYTFVRETEAYQKLQAVPSEQLSEYISLVYQPDVSIELGEKAFPLLLETNMKDKLPPGWSEEEKNRFIQENVLPNSRGAMQECLAPFKTRINYQHQASSQININYRQWLKDEYCEDNNNECTTIEPADENACQIAPTINLISGNPDESDLDVVASCVYEGVLRSIEPLLGGIIAAQKDVFADSMELNDEMVQSFTDRTMDELMRCVNTDEHTRAVYRQQGGYNPVFLSKTDINASTLRKFTPTQFTDLLVRCSGQAEKVVSADFVQQLVLNNPTIASTFNSGETIQINGQDFSQESTIIARRIVEESFNPCMERQEEIKSNPNNQHSLTNIEATICTPLVEMHAAQFVIDRTLAKTYADEELNENEEVLASLRDYNQCASAARTQMLNDIGNKTSTTPLTNARQASQYIEENPAFYNCVSDAISDSAHIIGGEKYEEMVNTMIRQGKIINKNDIRALKSDVQILLKNCFKDKLDDLENFRAFSVYNESGGLDELQSQCQEQVTELVFPQILVKEAGSQLRSLQRQGLIGENDISLILSQTAASLRSGDNISVPSDLDYQSGYRPLKTYEEYLTLHPSGNVEDYYKEYGKLTHWSYLESYRRWHDNNPEEEMEDYLGHYQAALMPHAIREVRNEFFERLNHFTSSSPAPQRRFTELEAILDAKCMSDLFENMQDSFKDSSSDKPFVLDDLLKSISDGLKYSHSLGATRHNDNMRKFQQVCDNPNQVKSLEDLMSTGAMDFIAKQQIYSAVKEKFESMPEDDFATEQASFGSDTRKMAFARKKRDDMQELVRNFMGDPLKFEQFLFDGKNQDLINFALNNKDELEDPNGRKMKELTTMVVGKMFNDKSKDSFADQFSKIQLVNALGIAGYESARDAVDAAAEEQGWYANDTVRREARRALNDQWTTTNIHNMIGWNNLNNSTRTDLIENMITNAVIPSVDGSSAAQQAQKRDRLKDRLVRHTQEYEYSVNYRTTKNGIFSQSVTNQVEKVTFEERLSRRITRQVENNVSTFDIAGEIWNEI